MKRKISKPQFNLFFSRIILYLEIIAINDRSTDNTGAILNRIAENESRIHILHIDKLPSGWLGKVNAMHQGVKQATGEWLLFCDADIHFSSGMLKRAIIFSRQQKIDHLTLLPSVSINNFWLGVCIVTFGMFFLLSSRAAFVNRPNDKTPMGVGAFNLVKTETFNQTQGFEWLRLEPGDDYGLGLMINKAGGRTHFAFGDADISVPWYGSLTEMFKGLEKNMFGPGAHYLWWRMLSVVTLMWAMMAAPTIALVAGAITQSWPMFISGVIAVGVHVVFSIIFIRKERSETWRLLFIPVGIFLFGLMLLWSGYTCTKNGGIDWRGTHYTLKELRAGQRVKF